MDSHPLFFYKYRSTRWVNTHKHINLHAHILPYIFEQFCSIQQLLYKNFLFLFLEKDILS